MNRLAAIVIAALVCNTTALAQEPTVTLQSTVTGNQELPRVMYIVPWRQPGETEFSWEPEPGIAAGLFQPLRRDEFVRGIHYQNMIESADGAPPHASTNEQGSGD